MATTQLTIRLAAQNTIRHDTMYVRRLLGERAKWAISSYLWNNENMFVCGCVAMIATKLLDRVFLFDVMHDLS